MLTKLGSNLFEDLEARRLLSASLVNGILTIEGTTGDDTISISNNPGDFSHFTVTTNGTPQEFLRSDIGNHTYPFRYIFIFGRAGNDRIEVDESSGVVNFEIWIDGGGGNDTLVAGQFPDTLFGRDGDDEIHGGKSSDFIHGGDGNDKIFGGAGDEVIYGGTGDDRIYGEAGFDHIKGGGGNDRISGGADEDRIFGGDGNDSLMGDEGNDLILGGLGDDDLDGGTGVDSLFGQLGNDDFVGTLDVSSEKHLIFEDNGNNSLV